MAVLALLDGSIGIAGWQYWHCSFQYGFKDFYN